MRTIVLSNIPLIAAALAVATVGCDGEIRPPKNRPAGSEPAAQPPGGTAPAAANPATTNAPVTSNGSGDDRAIGTLATRELIDVCKRSNENLARALAAQVQIECTATALSQNGCNTARQKCIDENKPRDEDAANCEMEAAQLATDCATVSIGALGSCEEAWIRELEETADSLDCDSSMDTIREVSDRKAPAECQSVDTRCNNQGM